MNAYTLCTRSLFCRYLTRWLSRYSSGRVHLRRCGFGTHLSRVGIFSLYFLSQKSVQPGTSVYLHCTLYEYSVINKADRQTGSESEWICFSACATIQTPESRSLWWQNLSKLWRLLRALPSRHRFSRLSQTLRLRFDLGRNATKHRQTTIWWVCNQLWRELEWTASACVEKHWVVT